MNRVGHAFIKRRMREENAMFGGEVTGHYYFRDNFYADNGFIPALMILDLMSKKGLSLRDLLKPLRERYFISGEINTKVANMEIAGQEDRRAEEDLREGQSLRPRWRVGGIRRLAFQRPPVEYRAAAAPQSRGLDAGDHGKAPRRGAGDNSRIVDAALRADLDQLEFGSLSGSNSAVERSFPSSMVAGSIPVSRSIRLEFIPPLARCKSRSWRATTRTGRPRWPPSRELHA